MQYIAIASARHPAAMTGSLRERLRSIGIVLFPAELWSQIAMKQEAGGPIAACKLNTVRTRRLPLVTALTALGMAFLKRDGGKVLIWHGLSDQLIFPEGTIDYYERAIDNTSGLKETQNFARLFLAPGVGHCGGGNGPSSFDMFAELVKWVESGQAPDRIVAERMQNNQVVRSRLFAPIPRLRHIPEPAARTTRRTSCATPFEYGVRWIK